MGCALIDWYANSGADVTVPELFQASCPSHISKDISPQRAIVHLDLKWLWAAWVRSNTRAKRTTLDELGKQRRNTNSHSTASARLEGERRYVREKDGEFADLRCEFREMRALLMTRMWRVGHAHN